MKKFERKLSQNRLNVVITGGNGFVAQELAKALLSNTCELRFDELILVDIEKPVSPVPDPRVICLTFDLTEDHAIEELFNINIDVIFHLAAVVSGHAERDLDLGHKVNVESTYKLLEAIRHKDGPLTRFVFTSTLGVYGKPELFDGELNELSGHLPQTSYGFQKSISELLINDYTRKGFVDGRVVRLPNIAIRSVGANQAVTSFISAIVKEPLSGKVSICPVKKETKVWISSPDTLAKNLIHAAQLPASNFGSHRNVNLPGITVSVEEMLECLSTTAGEETSQLVRFELDEELQAIIDTLPVSFNIERALSLGFFRDNSFTQVLHNYIHSQCFCHRRDSSDSSSSESSCDNK